MLSSILFVVILMNSSVGGRFIHDSLKAEDNSLDIKLGTEENKSIGEIVASDANGCDCEDGSCEKDSEGNYVCKCKGWGLVPANTWNKQYCKKCDCGKDFNCTFSQSGFWGTVTKLKCLCPDGYSEKGYGSSKTCKEFDPCSPNPCKNAGKCAVKDGQAICICTERFTGTFCETEFDPCYPNPCKNAGTCAVKDGQAMCICTERFTGTFCETEFDLCYPNPCKNAGTCAVKNGQAMCICIERFTGTFCETDLGTSLTPTATSEVSVSFELIKELSTLTPQDNRTELDTRTSDLYTSYSDVLSSNIDIKTTTTSVNSVYTTENLTSTTKLSSVNLSPNITLSTRGIVTTTSQVLTTEETPCPWNLCSNGGLCRVENNAVKCYCKQPYHGKYCDSATSLCTWNPCSNGGICRVEKNTEKCYCKQPYHGKYCESSSELCARISCKNEGICKVENGVAKCYCKKFYSGEFCEYFKEFDGTIIFLSLSSIAVVILITIALIQCRSNHLLSQMSKATQLKT